MALLLPKLRSLFAEFLDNASPVGLRILSSSTCVGLRYGHHENNSGFSRLPAHADSLLLVRSDSYGRSYPADLPTGRPSYLHRYFLHRPALTRSVPTVLFHGGTGISTCYPSTTPFGLALGPDLPRADQPCPGNLGYSAGRILTFLSLLIPAFSLLITPRLLSVTLRRDHNAPLPIDCQRVTTYPRASVVCFSPGHFRRRTSRLVSCYALFE